MNKLMDKKYLTPQNVYLVVSLSGIILFFLVAIFKRVEIFDWVMMENNSNWATFDYFRHIHHSQYHQQMYFEKTDAVFPPLAYMMYYYIYRISYGAFYTEDYKSMLTEPYQIIIFIMYTLVAILWLSYIIEELQISTVKKRMLLFSIVFSVPMFAGAIERGNMALYVIVIILNALIWKDSNVYWKRELALILIAIAAGLKVYPAVLGLIYIKEKRWKESIRLIIYGIIAFFVPFVFFGKFDGVLAYVKILTDLTNKEYGARIQFFKGLMSFTSLSDEAISILNMLFMVGLLIAIFCTKNKLREMVYLASFMTFVPSNAFRYTLIYFLPVVYLLFSENDKNTPPHMDNYIYAIMLGALFSIPTLFGMLTGFRLNFGIFTYTYVERYIYTLAWGCLIYSVLMELITLGRHGRSELG